MLSTSPSALMLPPLPPPFPQFHTIRHHSLGTGNFLRQPSLGTTPSQQKSSPLAFANDTTMVEPRTHSPCNLSASTSNLLCTTQWQIPRSSTKHTFLLLLLLLILLFIVWYTSLGTTCRRCFALVWLSACLL
mmetsp:Transcript_28242/g.45718  ORF Transcript_28242/g.45718 Transcript_28242/m.45718 type:complete len:132 (-) Transcript_28242:4725-5120(-)